MQLPKLEAVDVVIFHNPCSDGFCAAWVIYNKFGSAVECLKGNYSEDRYDSGYWLGKVSGKRVVCVDFSFPRELTKELHATAESFIVLDHHPSAEEELAGLDYCYIANDKSGAMMAWEACHGERPHP